MLEWILSRLLAKDLQVSNGLSLFKSPLCKDTPTLPLFSTPSIMLYCTVYIYVIYIYTQYWMMPDFQERNPKAEACKASFLHGAIYMDHSLLLSIDVMCFNDNYLVIKFEDHPSYVVVIGCP